MKRWMGSMAVAVISLMGSPHGEAQLEPDFSTRISLMIHDGNGKPIPDVDAMILFGHLLSGRDKTYRGKSDEKGMFEATDKVSGMVWVKAEKEGYYVSSNRRALLRMDVDYQTIKEREIPFVLRRRLRPTALYARKVDRHLPIQGEWAGFDLKAGDWVQPYGKGVEADFLFKYEKKFEGFREEGERLEDLREFSKKVCERDGKPWSEEYFRDAAGKWSGRLEMSFPREKEGIVVVDKDYCDYSELAMPNEAYPEGYLPVWNDDEIQKMAPKVGKLIRGYFLRTRVELNGEGGIRSAHYAKITEEIYFDPRGKIRFSYAFNPTANDRNLEFDPERNLFRDLKEEEKVRKP